MQKNKQIRSNSIKVYKKIGYYIPIMFIIAIIPLITFGKIVELPLDEANFWKGGTTHIDFFCYYKSIVFIIATLAAFAAYGGLFLDNKLSLQREKRYYIPMSIYALFTIISTVMSQNKNVSLVGFIEMYQGMSVLLCYMLITFILINYTNDERDVKIIVYSFVAVTIVEGLLGLSQYFGYDFLQSPLGQWLITPKELEGFDLKFAFGKFTIYGTMYNTNFVGSFGALVLPLTTILYLFAKGKKKTVIFGLCALLAFATWIGCNSRAGYLGIIAAFILGAIIFRKIIKEKYKKALILLAGFLVIVFGFNSLAEGRVLGQFSRLNPANEVKNIGNIKEQQTIKFEEVSVKDNSFTIKTNNETLICSIEDSTLSFKDEKGNILDVEVDEDGYIKLVDEKYAGYSFIMPIEKSSQIKCNLYGRNLEIYITPDQKMKVISLNNKLTEPIEAPRLKIFDGRETFASNRGYIWSRTIPMMKDTILVGYGPDNYPMVFPQEDYVGRFNVGSYGMTDIVVDKPHNMFLQTAINTGVISLIALLVMWAIYLIDSLKLYISGNMKTFVEYMGASVFLSITAYLVAGIFNDNVISVAPLFWILLGTGIGINKMIRGTT